MKNTRRDFLKIVGTTAGGTLFLPKFLTAQPSALLEKSYNANRQILVVVQLNGGNDGLNTFIPYTDPEYYRLRPNVAIAPEKVLKATSGMGWHPSMTGMAQIQQAGHLAVAQNVGYPNPNRSHFRSIEIWQTGSGANQFLNKGWLGRYLDATCQPEDTLGALNLDNIDSLSLRGESAHFLTLQNPQRFEQQLKAMSGNIDDPLDENPNLDFVRKLMLSSFEGSDQIKAAIAKSRQTNAVYPAFGLAKNLEWVSKMIKGDLPTSVFYTSLGGFDTHVNQLGKHQNLMKEVSESVKAFYDDMRNAGLLNNVTLMVFSEFGRRVKDNGSGTDHGTAAPVFIIGGKNTGKIIGTNPNLLNLDNGDLKFDIDFRSLYASILQEKFAIAPEKVGIEQKILRGVFA